MTTFDPAPKPSLLATLDRVLRGDFVRRETVATGRIDVPTALLVRLALMLGGIYGVCLGLFGVFHGSPDAGLQLLAGAAKVPLLFVLTLVVTFPSLYVFAALQRLPLDISDTMRLLLLAMLVHLAVLASLGPVFAFFAASTNSYAFMKLLNVAFFVVGGVLGFVVLRSGTRGPEPLPPEPLPKGPADPGPDESVDPPPIPRSAAHQRKNRMLRIWCLVYAIVGAQMGWLLRPFLGSPDLPFGLLRAREGNIFTDVVQTLGQLFGG